MPPKPIPFATASRGTYTSRFLAAPSSVPALRLLQSGRVEHAAPGIRRLLDYTPEINQDAFATDNAARASVLVPLCVNEQTGEIDILFTVRSKKIKSFPDEVALPGGRMDPQDLDPVYTAVREAREEIGLKPNQIEIVTRLVGFMSRNALLVTPIVAFIPPVKTQHPDQEFRPEINPQEVDHIFYAPLSTLFDSKRHRTEKTQNSPARHAFDLPTGHITFGLTAHILVHLASVFTGGDRLLPYSTFGAFPADERMFLTSRARHEEMRKKGETFADDERRRREREMKKGQGLFGGVKPKV
ncbi:hypothetical protein M427DRAFT_56064 [Gonapodya prolifera JEL478]|uniref:Nudix hydrolase domain-containing protein n=1 Tax=Gonapodya prolifera (strain JEL478) TaxID=1344416 RepID=A0A139AHE1_GONPJ|nr:hypothetical protein M427DRAFT_56064 [Gonapodya prolifera JEL478]|eukprot:KXS16180.1 hypothetical protein M427DRAFT_56064 [Gonapodya prolifera JEL478]